MQNYINESVGELFDKPKHINKGSSPAYDVDRRVKNFKLPLNPIGKSLEYLLLYLLWL